ncbi:CAAD domain-containing protein [Synechococcus sp. M16CYN]|uniref:CAAD domain-containing protein n=1 Tax=Synechococcus sp. M16CYN TaxID=3103139 RepID=UPI0030E35D92
MSDATTEVKEDSTSDTWRSNVGSTASPEEEKTSFASRYSDVLGSVNQILDQVDWNQMGRIGKIIGIFTAVIVAQILIKGVLDTINLLPIIPGILELLGLIVVGQWSWKNLATSEKRTDLIQRVQTVRHEYFS